MIIINLDFTSGNEISYYEGLKAKDYFETNCLDFFSFSYEADVKVLKKNGDYILKSELLKDSSPHTDKEIRESHNIRKILVANGFDFKKGTPPPLTHDRMIKDDLDKLDKELNDCYYNGSDYINPLHTIADILYKMNEKDN